MVTELSEERKKEICKCGDCGYSPLKHFEKCPNCFSQAFHCVIFEGEEKNAEITENN